VKHEFFSIFLIAFGLGTATFLYKDESSALPEPQAIEIVREFPVSEEPLLRQAAERMPMSAPQFTAKPVIPIKTLKALKAAKSTKSTKTSSVIAIKRPAVKVIKSAKTVKIAKAAVRPAAYRVVEGRRFKVSRVDFTSQDMDDQQKRQEELTPEKVKAAYDRERGISSIDDQIVDSTELN
jgi:hypothetical protein